MAAKRNLSAMHPLNRYADTVYSLMRFIVGLMFACHGGQKLLGFPAGGHGPAEGLMMVGGYIELICGLLMAFGLFTRIAAFIACGEMAVAYFMMHAKGGFFPIVNHGELAVAYCFVFLFIIFHGPGSLSLDSLIFKRAATPARASYGT